MIQEPSKDLTLVIYNTPKPPKYIKINKGLMRSLTFIIPFVLFFSIAFSVFTSVYSKKKLEEVKNKEPETILKLEDEKVKLKDQIFALEQTNEDLTQKVAKGATTSDSSLALFSQPLGYENLLSKDLAKIENMTFQESGQKIIFKFDLLNNTPESDRLAGYIAIIEYTESGMAFYPAMNFLDDALVLDYSSGESFVISKFRPVIAEFDKKVNQQSARFKIFIFSRTGNLLSFATTEKYNLK